MKLITLHVPEARLKQLDRVVEKGHYYCRAEAIRAAIRDLVNSEL